MSKNIQTVTKWLPIEISKFAVFDECRIFRKQSNILTKQISDLLLILKYHNCVKHCKDDIDKLEQLKIISEEMDIIVNNFDKIFIQLTTDQTAIFKEKINLWKNILINIKLKLCYLIQDLINEIAYLFIYFGDEFLNITLRISIAFNNLLTADFRLGIKKCIRICSNTCPYLLFPMRKFSVTKLLQIIARNRAEICCHKLIDCLLETYKIYDTHDDDNNSDNSSIEIYKALTKHMSPPDHLKNFEIQIEDQQATLSSSSMDNGQFSSIENLINCEEKHVFILLEATLLHAPAMLGNDSIKQIDGNKTINTKASKKVLCYYEEILWAEVGNYLEHIILWWGSSPLAAKSPHSSQHLREWIQQYIPNSDIPHTVLSALTCLTDALGVHVTSTLWDQLFRQALVSSSSIKNDECGKLFCSVLQNLIVLCNQFETTPEWIEGAPLDELPLVEQIPVLHRLDHSIHTTRLWAFNQCKKLANNWNVDAFFMVIHEDVSECLSQLKLLSFTDHTIAIEKGKLGEHIQVCTLMRAKLVSEVNVNINKLKETTKECINILACICRTISLANLQMIFPDNTYWKTINKLPDKESSYVEKYLEQILLPVLKATNDDNISNMILQIMCEAWLDHIYVYKIKFNQHSAYQLLFDFAYVGNWLINCSIIDSIMKKKMLNNEILKRCEGVGRLLLRCPGEQIKMIDSNKKTQQQQQQQQNNDNDDNNSDSSGQLMPAEMYVPNQEKWLELRANKKRGLFTICLCCGKI